MTSASLLEVHNVSVDYPAKGFRATPYRALTNVSLSLRRGETLGLVGESGSGKTTLGRAILGLVGTSSGGIRFDGRDITNSSRRTRRVISKDMQVIFQDPYTSLNPSMSIADILAEPLLAQGISRTGAREHVVGLLDRVRLPSDAAERLPREFSGGQRQRIAIARALALSPKLIVCDEPVSALDLTTQATVLDLLIELQNETGVAYLFVSHDLSVIRHISHRVTVMHQGSLVESGSTEQVTERPEHPYTKKLLMSAPLPDPDAQKERRAQRREMARLDAEQGQTGGFPAVAPDDVP
ncbi:ATP-binding cassette domain-containing protein [Microbacterium sp. PMB16]|uniref:ATP-binding cassette domain-containing protein n=1 Tax=Microbacterium sp. PMB16 TaxID=3120157 RepID=UPI003F4C8894